MHVTKISVKAEWDQEAGVYVATSEDIPGLITEAATSEELDAKLAILIPELLHLNCGIVDAQAVPEDDFQEVNLVVTSERTSKVRLHA